MESIEEFGKEPVFNTIDRSYVSSKVAKVRWTPDGEYLVTGSYSELENTVDLWHYPRESVENEGYPKKKFSLRASSDVTELKFVGKERFIYSSKRGDLNLVSVRGDLLRVEHAWDRDSFSGGSLLGFDVDDQGNIALITGDGQIACFSYSDDKGLSTLVGSGKDNIKCVSFLRHHELAQGNLRGQISIWDFREDVVNPSLMFPYNGDSAVGVTCLAPFPVRKHMLVAAGLDGTVSTWDLRKHSTSQTIYAAHSKPVSSLMFHPSRPTNAFTTSYSGEVWHWTNFYELLSSGTPEQASKEGLQYHLYGELINMVSEAKPDVRSLIGEKKFPTNCCDINDERLVCSTDNDCLVFVHPLQLK